MDYEAGDLLDPVYQIGDRLYGYLYLDSDITIKSDYPYASTWGQYECPICNGLDTCLLSPAKYKYYNPRANIYVRGVYHCIDCGLVWQFWEINEED